MFYVSMFYCLSCMRIYTVYKTFGENSNDIQQMISYNEIITILFSIHDFKYGQGVLLKSCLFSQLNVDTFIQHTLEGCMNTAMSCHILAG